MPTLAPGDAGGKGCVFMSCRHINLALHTQPAATALGHAGLIDGNGGMRVWGGHGVAGR